MAALAALTGLGATMVELPYYALSPGSAVEVDGLVSAGEFSTAPSDGHIYLLTVRLSQVSLVDAFRGWIDPEVDVIERGRILAGDMTDRELAEVNRAEMADSKDAALAVAFEELGYDAVTGQGARIVQVTAGSPAGMALAPGDTIVEIDGMAVTTHYDVLDVLAARSPGDALDLVVDNERTGRARQVRVVLDRALGDPSSAFLGATLSTRSPLLNLPFPVDISLDDVGGPSAGLAFTLEVLDALTPGDLTGGQRVAVTGTIELDGSVGPVGGVAQKIAAARHRGVDLMLVPRAEADEAGRQADGGLAIEAVDSLSGALQVLADHGGDPLSPTR